MLLAAYYVGTSVLLSVKVYRDVVHSIVRLGKIGILLENTFREILINVMIKSAESV